MGGPQLRSRMTSPGPARPALLSTWSADVNQHSGLLPSCPGPGPTLHSGSPENAEALPRDQCPGQEGAAAGKFQELPSRSLAVKHVFISSSLVQALASLHPGLGLYLPSAVWNEGLLALNSSTVASWGLKQNQAPPGKQLTSNWGGGGHGAGTSPSHSSGAGNTVAVPILEAHPVACVKDLLQTQLEKHRRKIPKALARGSAA